MTVLDIEDLSQVIPNAIVTSGTFDGVHVGHQKILKDISDQARETKGKSVVLTFWPHPRFVIKNKNGLKLLSTFDEKAEVIENMGVDYLVKIKFTKEFSELDSDEYIRSILIDKLGCKKLVIGYDHRFGKNREGGFDYLIENQNKFGFEVQEIPRQDIDNIGVSSTKIRNALSEGNVHIAHQYLGRPYEISGRVEHGNKIGSEIGFPTANISVDEEYKLIPKNGVYAVLIKVKEEIYEGMMNIGLRPTVDGDTKKMEVNIFDFSAEIYQEKISVQFISFIRDEHKFDNIGLLKQQLSRDKIEAKKNLS